MARNSIPFGLNFIIAFLWIAACPSRGAESRWIRLQSANFEMYSSANPRSARETIQEFEQVRGFFLQVLGGRPAKPVPVRLVAFASAKEFEPYKLNEFATAYYQQTAGRDYIVMSHAGADTFPIAVHEYVHLLVKHSGLKLPPWLNEGLAELYSTLRPLADKILVGDLIPSRHRALLEGKWAPLAVILAAGHDSPYYNEKDKASSLYNEGWALTHMLFFRAEFRPKFSQLVTAISAGKESAPALTEVYGRTVAQIEKDLQGYLRGSSFQGALFSAKLDKASGEIPAETLTDFDADLMLADLMYRPGKETAQQAALERLAQREPKRPEPCQGLGYLAWRAGRTAEAMEQFGMAFERGDRDPGLLWDYGRLLERNREKEAIRVFSELLTQDAGRVDVRLELAATQLQNDDAAGALATLSPIHTVTPADSARFFGIAVHAHLRNGDQKDAEEVAKHFRDVAKTDDDRAAAEALMNQAAARSEKAAAVAELTGAGRPTLRRVEPAMDSTELRNQTPAESLSTSGRFVELDCRGKQARMIVLTAAGRKVFLIEDSENVAITAPSEGPVEMSCGPQKIPAKVQIGYEQPRPTQTGIDGIVRTLVF